MKAIRFMKTGEPAVLQLCELPLPVLQSGQVLMRVAFAGVNLIDTYHRKGVYPVAFLPGGAPLGGEACGSVVAIGPNVARVSVGDVVCGLTPPGAYATHHVVPEEQLLRVPKGLELDLVAASFLKGMTARYLVKETFRVQSGNHCLLYAAAGGTGQLLVQWIKHLGGVVIAVVSTEEKAAVVRRLGADHVILSSEDIAKRVRAICSEGVDVAYDSVGKDTFAASLDSLRRRGMMVSFGNASGPVPDFPPLLLSAKGSLYLTRPKLTDYVPDRASLEANAADVFEGLQSFLKVERPERFSLSDAAAAHARLESRGTTGALVLQCNDN